MGEKSKQIGEELERYAVKLLKKLGYEILGMNLEVKCNKSQHMNKNNNPKRTHGIDILAGYYNPLTKRKETIIVECKHYEWSGFTCGVDSWLNELVNNVECSSTSEVVNNLLDGHIIVGAILFYQSSDNKYDEKKKAEAIANLKLSRKKSPFTIYIVDNKKIEMWEDLLVKIDELQKESENDSFSIVYPATGTSRYEATKCIIPALLFSDYLIASYEKKIVESDCIRSANVVTIFDFDSFQVESFRYLYSIINFFQLESCISSKMLIIEIYCYPRSKEEITMIRENFNKEKKFDKKYKLEILKNSSMPQSYYIE